MDQNEISKFLDRVKEKGNYSTRKAAEKIGVSVGGLLYWERRGIVRSRSIWRGKRKIRQYSEENIKNATLVKLLMDTGNYTLERAMERLRQLG